MTHWINEGTGYKGKEAPSRKGPGFHEEPDVIGDMELKSPIGKSDHVLIELKLSRGRQEIRSKDHNAEKYDFSESNFTELRKYFEKPN